MPKPWEKYQGAEGPWRKYPEQPVPLISAETIGSALSLAKDALPQITAQGRELLNRGFGGWPQGPDMLRGVKDYNLRREMAIRDNPQEVSALLDQRAGKGNWYQDKRGKYILRPEGLSALGIDPAQYGNRPVAIDEAGLSLADMEEFAAQAAAPTTGAVLGASLGLSLGPLGSAAGAAIGAMGAKGIQEAWESTTGRNLQSPRDIGLDLAYEGAMNALPGEMARRQVGRLGGGLLAPFAADITPAQADVLHEATRMGVRPAFGQVLPDVPVASRMSGIASRIFPHTKTKRENIRALERAVADLVKDLPDDLSEAEAGAAVREALQASNEGFKEWGRKLYGPLVSRVGGADVPVVPTDKIRQIAEEVRTSLPTTVKGGQEEPMTMGASEYAHLQDFMGLQDKMSLNQIWALRDRLRTMQTRPEMNPGIAKKTIDRLYRATSDAMQDIPEHGAYAGALNRIYRKQITRRQDQLFDRILREPGKVGSLEPEAIVDRLVAPRSGTRVAKFMSQIPPEYKPKIQRAFMGKLMRESARGLDDVTDFLSSGRGFLSTLRKYDTDTLNAMFGRSRTSEMFRLARVMDLNARHMNDYGQLVAAAIAARPLANLGRMAQMRGLSKLFDTSLGMKWLTEGLDISNRRLVREGMTKGEKASTLAKNALQSAIQQTSMLLTTLGAHGAMGTGEGRPD
jgi:hypothetical protein